MRSKIERFYKPSLLSRLLFQYMYILPLIISVFLILMSTLVTYSTNDKKSILLWILTLIYIVFHIITLIIHIKEIKKENKK